MVSHRKNFWIIVITALICWQSPDHASADGVIMLRSGSESRYVQRFFDYLVDVRGEYSFKDVGQGLQKTKWVRNTRGGLNFGYTDSVIWVKGTVKYTGPSDGSFVFEVAYPVLDDIAVYISRPEGVTELRMGDKYPFYERPLRHRNFLVPVTFKPEETITLYFRVKTTSSMQIPLNVYPEDKMASRSQADMLGLGLYSGAMLIMIVYNLFIFFSIRESTYLYYVIYVFFMTLWSTSLNGLTFQYLWPQATVWNDQVIVFALNGIVFFASMFASRFLDARKTYPVNARLFMVLPVISFFMMLSAYVIPYRIGISTAMIFAVITILYGSVITVLRLRDGFALARIFILAWAMILAGGVIMALNKFAWLPQNVLTEKAIYVGAVIEVALLSFALAHRFNLEKKERIEAQYTAGIHERYARIAKENELLNERKLLAARDESLVVQKRLTEQLEAKIEERRLELNENLDKIRLAHDKIMENLAYARLIQSAMLPDPEDVAAIFPDHFIWYAPREIVGGDFYYIDTIDQGVLVAVADCTGHGVPGAFMTLVANWELKRIVKGEKCYDPAEILAKMNKRIKKTLKQDQAGSFSDDGLDMAVCVVDTEKKRLSYAGARIDLRYGLNHEIHTIKGDRRSLGYIAFKGDYRYTVHHLDVENQMTVYLATDGVPDQPGEKGQRFGSARLNEAIAAHSNQPLPLQCERLKETLMTYRGERDQVDDMTMVAFNTEF